MTDDHSEFHSSNAFCGNAGPEEMQHLHELIDKLTDKQLKLLTEKVGISFDADSSQLEREEYENVIDEADREDFYREYSKILSSSKKK